MVVKKMSEKPTPEKTTEKVESKKTKVQGIEVDIAGIYIDSLRKEVKYDKTLTIPRREDAKVFFQEAVLMALLAEDADVRVVAYYPAKRRPREVDVEVSFIGKTPFDLEADELFAAKCYYGLRNIRCDRNIMKAQKQVYMQICEKLELQKPTSEYTEEWPIMTLKVMRTPNGDTLVNQRDPIRFIDDGDYWTKKVAYMKPGENQFAGTPE